MKDMTLEEKTIQFIQKVAESYSNETLYAGNSGGKDSAVLDYLLQKSGIKYESFYANTTIDPPGTIGYIRKNYPHTKILQPEISFYKLVEKKGLPTRLTRFCCERLKEYVSIGKIVFEGIRSCEGTKRQGRDYIQCDTRKSQKGAQHIYPLYDWTDEDIWNFIEEKQIKLAPHYETGACRLGCVGCPLVYSSKRKKAEFDLYPKHYEATKKAIERGMAKNPQWKLSILCAAEKARYGLPAENMGELAMTWWLSGKTMNAFFSVCP